MVTMRYDGDGRRVELVVRSAGVTTTTTFRYQGSAIAQELTNGTLTRTYVTDGAGTIVKVCDPDCTGTNPQYLVTHNGHGDALALWRIEATGSLTLANSYAYSTWGTPTVHNSAGTPIAWSDPANLRFRYLYVGASGVAWDDAGVGLGLLHMGARHYSPALGRFLQPDPSAAEANLYGYAGGSPVTKVDPSGLWCEFTFFLGLEAVVISCGLVAVGAGVAALASWFATHPVTVPCLWNCQIDVRIRGVAPASVTTLAGRDSWWRGIISQGWNIANQDKRLTLGDIRTLKRAGFDPEELKEGRSDLDLWKTPSGDVVIKPRSGRGPGEPTHINLRRLGRYRGR